MSDSATATFDCPWCERTATSRTEFRVHLMVDHRKRKLAEFVADSLEKTSLSEHDEEPEPTGRAELNTSTGRNEIAQGGTDEESGSATDREPEPVTM